MQSVKKLVMPGNEETMSAALAYVAHDALEDFAREIFLKHGLDQDGASCVARGLVEANLRGVDSHGVSRIPMYCERLRQKVVNPRPSIKISNVTPVCALVDGDDGMGFLVGREGMAAAITSAETYGIGLAGARRSTHYGMAALYVMQAIDAGMIGLAYTNSSPALPVWGGRTAFLGASPFAAGVPAGQSAPYVLDMAMTVIARGKIRLAAQRGDAIPLGLALDAAGRPTTDATEAFAGVCLPFGGVKGSALSMLMEIMAGVLTGANFAGGVKSLYFDHSAPQNVGHLFIAIRPNLFMSSDEFGQRMDTLAERAKECPKAEGFDEILMPGEPEVRTKQLRSRTGIPFTPDVLNGLREEAAAAGIPLPSITDAPLDDAS
jgi:LDH2 family malate/lactate/ureidoglycolate dehydrogenase